MRNGRGPAAVTGYWPFDSHCLHVQMGRERAGLKPEARRRSQRCSTPLSKEKRVSVRFFSLMASVLLAATGCRRAPFQDAGEAASTPPRLVSLAPNLTEILFAVGAGDRIVGRTAACDYPPEVERIPIVGDFGAPSFEKLIQLKPTAILYADLEDRTLPERLRAAGLQPVGIPCLTLDDISAAMEQIAILAGREETGRAAAAQFREKVAQERRRAAGYLRKPRVYVEYWGDPLYSAGRGSFVSELVALAGGTNLGDEIAAPYFQASPEWVLARDPEVILCLYHLTDGSPIERIRSRRAWQNVRAVREGRLCADLDVNCILRPGPRVLEGVRQLRRCLQPDDQQAPLTIP